MDGAAAIDELFDLFAAADPVPFGGSDVYVDLDAYRAIVERMRPAGRAIGGSGIDLPEKRIGELIDELEGLGADPQRARRGERHRFDRGKVMTALRELQVLLPMAEERVQVQRSRPRTQRVELDDPGAPTLEELVERVERDHERFLISRGGVLIADLVSPTAAR